MARKTSIVAGGIKADELLGFQLRDAVAAGNAAIESLSGGSSTPVPYFGPGGVTYWVLNAIQDDDTDGNTCTMQWLVPIGTDKLTLFYKYIKANGNYGKLKKYVENDFTESEISSGFVEFTMPGIKANKSFDILKAVAKGDGARATNPMSDPDPSTLASGAADVGTAPASTGGFPPGSFTPALSSAVLARVISGDYTPAVMRVTDVGTPLREPDGIYYPVTVQFTAGSYVQDIKLRYQRCGKRRTSGGSGATGQNTIDLTIYGKPKFTPWYEVSDAERAAGSCEINVGPFTRAQARKTWHITRVRARSVVDEKNGDKIVKEKYPAADADMATAPNDLSPGNAVTTASYPSAFVAGAGSIPGIDATATNGTPDNPGATDTAQGAMLAVLTPQQPVTSTPSEPASGDVVRNTPDLATEKDNDAIIELRCYVDDSNNSAKAQDVNASEVVFILARDGEEADQTKWKRFVVALEEDDTHAILQFHRRIGTRWNWIKNVLRNSTSRTTSTVTNYEFQAGNTAYAGVNAIQALSIGTIGTGSNSDDDAGMFRFNVPLVNTAVAATDNLPAIPKRLYIFKNRKGTAPSSVGSFDLAGGTKPETGDTNWVLDQVIGLRDQPILATAGTHNIAVTIKTRRKKTVKYYAAVSAVGDDELENSTVGSYDTNTDLPVTNYAHGTKNIIRGGSFVFSKEDASGGAADEPARKWEDWTGGTFSGTDIDSGTTTNVYWEKADHRLRLVDNKNAVIACKIKKILVPGDVYTLSMLVRAQGALGLSESFSLQLYYNNGGGGTGTILASAVTISVTAPGSGSDYKLIAFQFTMPSFTIREELWVVFTRTTALASQFGDIVVDNWMLVRGNQALTWDSSGPEDDWETVAAASTTYSDTGSGDVDANAGGGNDGSLATAGGGKSGALDV